MSAPVEAGLAIRETPLVALHPAPDNPRKISAERLEQLKRSLEADREMLAVRPLIALLDGTVVCGNQRLRAAQALGWETIPAVLVELDERRAKEWMLRDNNEFDERFFPPAPVAAFAVICLGDEQPGEGLLDTGSSQSVLPLSAIPASAEPEGWRLVHFLTGPQLLRAYQVSVRIFGVEVPILAAAASDDEMAQIMPAPVETLALIGRDVLNATRWRFDGPARQVTAD